MAPKTKTTKHKKAGLLNKVSFSKPVLVVFAIIFAGIGGYAIYRSFAAGGTIYYVSSSGSDSNNGTSMSTPWKTVAKVNGSVIAAGSQVLFAGGQSFSGTLTPSSSGASGSPIFFGSYGSGNATINGGAYITSGEHDLTFDHLTFTNSTDQIFAAQGSGTSGTNDITLQNSVIQNSPYSGLQNGIADTNWVIRDNTFSNLGDSGLIIESTGTVIDGNTISNTGDNTSLTYGKHGIYAKAANMIISNNDISNDTNGSLISIRYHGDQVYGNLLHDSPVAVSFFPQDPSNAGTDYVYNNKMWNISDWIFYYAGPNDFGIDNNPNPVPTGMNLVFASNTAVLLPGAASDAQVVNLSELTAAHVWVVNNIFTGSYTYAYAGCPTCQEYNNDWFGGTQEIPNGTGDLHVNPNLAAGPSLALPGGSSLIDAGTANVPGLTYSVNSDGAPLHYTGAAPDMGAVESSTSSPPPSSNPPFPAAPPVLDNFNRAGPALGSNWTAPAFGDPGTAVITGSSAMTGGSGGDSDAVWTASTFGPDVEAYMDLSTLPAASDPVDLDVRDSTAGPNFNGYYITVFPTGNWTINRAGQGATLGSYTQVVHAGDSIGMSAIGSTIAAWYKPSGGSWTQVGSVTDSTYDNIGYIGADPVDSTARIDNFGGGTVSSTSSSSLPGDTNGDGQVNIIDLSTFLSNYGGTAGSCDFNGDGHVNILDLSILLSHYGQTVSTGFTVRGMYDSNGTQSAFTADWPSIAAQGINLLVLPSEWISNLQTLNAAGDKAWVSAGYWDDNAHAFSESQSAAVADISAACATGAVQGIYVADEPGLSIGGASASDISAIKTRATALKAACPAAKTIIAYYDAGSVAEWKGVIDAMALDIYPNQNVLNFNNSVITQLAAAADAAGIPYYGVIGAFTDGSNYTLPNASQLSTMYATWHATNELGWVVYSWGATSGNSSNNLENQPSLLSVIKAQP